MQSYRVLLNNYIYYLLSANLMICIKLMCLYTLRGLFIVTPL